MPRSITVLTDRYGELSETFVASEVAALRRLGHEVTVESVAHPSAPASVSPAAVVWEDETRAARARAMVWLAFTHPLGVLADLRDRRRWRRDEAVPPLRMLAPAAQRLANRPGAHLHVHFAAGAALAGLRLARLLGLPWSLTAHAWDIFQRPANLAEKLRAATFATTGCEYNLEHLRPFGGPVHEIVMGVDAEHFRRETPYPGGRTVVAVGRIVEKKGFGDLVAAAALMREAGAPPDRVIIAGDGPLAADLRALVAERSLGDLVELAGALSHEGVRGLLERADVLCMPCVVAADGDRDSMPVVVKEALAMEIPVVATDEVGLPEVVRPAWGRLVPPRDPAALATALTEVLALPAAERAAMGRAGRAHVVTSANVDREAARLTELIEGG